ncbi:MAG: ribbon-helix-helix domain-containing protein [Candidatus Shapirobacteria bacterium]|nr:ribbon-helix-helix domain-containing protein [Candidatus Shapirobacteria bacterium]MDD3002666.1 ribbon-helix-helix domain-containing protein [Candidatus Shapirobacteria bacterium]MDD4382847.1 ribbon-helix-helix domain-containing protein [Candidatus Shapirobacteria bacterium]
MRQIINISLPEKLSKMVDDATKDGQYASKSEFFRCLLRDWSEEQLYKKLKQSQKEMKNGKKFLLKSFKYLKNM